MRKRLWSLCSLNAQDSAAAAAPPARIIFALVLQLDRQRGFEWQRSWRDTRSKLTCDAPLSLFLKRCGLLGKVMTMLLARGVFLWRFCVVWDMRSLPFPLSLSRPVRARRE